MAFQRAGSVEHGVEVVRYTRKHFRKKQQLMPIGIVTLCQAGCGALTELSPQPFFQDWPWRIRHKLSLMYMQTLSLII
jgi:Fe-S oxidoreductase